MLTNKPEKRKLRLMRMLRLLTHLRPLVMPVTYRHNKVAFYSNGALFFKSLLTALRSAKHIILLEYYLIRNDHIGQAFAHELTDAVKRGVRVLLIYDYIGCLDTPSSYFKNLELAGVELTAFNVPSFKRGIGWFDRRDHRKMALIDHNLAFLGGFNIGDEYTGKLMPHYRFRDAGFSLSGSAIRELIKLFNDTWQMERGQAPELPVSSVASERNEHAGHANVAIVSGGPHQRSSYIRSAFLFNIASASEELLIANPYFVPGPRIIRALLRAAGRGVRVRLLMPARSDVPLVQLVGRSSYGTLLRGGIEIFEMRHEILHAKVMLVDGERTVIGSANLDQRSFHRNFEINCIIDSTTFGGQIRRMLESDFELSQPIRLDQHNARGSLMRIMEKIVNLFSWFL